MYCIYIVYVLYIQCIYNICIYTLYIEYLFPLIGLCCFAVSHGLGNPRVKFPRTVYKINQKGLGSD